MPPRRNRTPTNVHEQELEECIMARMEERKDQMVDQLTNRMVELMNQGGQRSRTHSQVEDGEFGNPFGGSDSSYSEDRLERPPKRDHRSDNRRWEAGMRIDIPEFDRVSLNSEGFINYLATVEEVFEFKEVPGNKRVSMIATRLHGRASAWCQQLKLTRDRLGNSKETEEQHVARYIGGLWVQIMDSVNMFDLVYISKAHQRALVFEKQSRRVGSLSSTANIGGSSGTGGMVPHVVPNQQRPTSNSVGPNPRTTVSSCLKCFSCGETDDWQNDDAGENYEYPPVYDEEHQCEQEVVTGDVGYKDDVWCDVVAMDACHLLLGKPWEYDHNIDHIGWTNTYSFLFGGVKITLVPNKPKEPISRPSGTLLTLNQFEDELEAKGEIFVLLGKEVAKEVEITEAMVPLLKEFADGFLNELPDGLPPLCDIEHHIDLQPGAQLPNRPHYRISPGEHEELRRQVEDLISKGHIRESMSLCAIPAC
ncbi:hypothetical protein Lser_V15G14297 [Lactuca serriola]